MHDAAHARRIASRTVDLQWGIGQFYTEVLWPKIHAASEQMKCGLEVVVTDKNIATLRAYLENLGYQTRLARGWLTADHGKVVSIWIGW